MRAFVTGATGFIGGHVVRKLRERGNEVRVLARTPSKAHAARDLGCHIVEGALSDTERLRDGVEGCDVLFHTAAMYEVGIPRSRRSAMFDANVRGTERVLDVAEAAGVDRVVHVSTLNYYGNTHGVVVDESYERSRDGFLSVYDRTKYLAHRIALARIAAGAPVTIACPGATYGPGDHSELGKQLRLMVAGRRPVVSFTDLGVNLVHVEDAAEGILLTHARGRPGQTYNLGGQIGTIWDFFEEAARILGARPPRRVPGALVKAVAPLGPVLGRVLGYAPNIGELVRVADGVTYWASDEKARRELGYAPRDLATGLRDTLARPPP